MLTKKMRDFCEEYVRNGYNATAAYRKVGNCKDDDGNTSVGSALIRKPEVQEYIRELQKELIKHFGDVESLIIKELSDDITYRDDKGHHSPTWTKSVDLLQKQMGLQTQKLDAKIGQEITINVRLEDDDE